MTELYGLIVCGGDSSRMGADKGLLQYYDLPQRYHLYHMLQPYCTKVFISCNSLQAQSIEAGYEYLVDATPYENIGPMAALLTAWDVYPKVSLLVIGCDYPFLQSADIKQLIAARSAEAQAVSFYNTAASMYQPLLAIYEQPLSEKVVHQFCRGKNSLRHTLLEAHATRVIPQDESILNSVDTIKEYEDAKSLLKRK
jgi:molybdopterin-guanine dinucleotide biosynthesis protein A